MGRRNTLGALVVGLASTLSGCVGSITTPVNTYSWNVEDEVKELILGEVEEEQEVVEEVTIEEKLNQIAKNVLEQKEHDGVIYDVSPEIVGVTIYEAVMIIGDRLYLIGAVDKNNDRKIEHMFIYSKKVNRQEAIEGMRDLLAYEKDNMFSTMVEQYAVKEAKGDVQYHLLDGNMKGNCTNVIWISPELLNPGVNSNITRQQLYELGINDIHAFYNN